ncbi:MAG: hypothetical protein HBSAPP04_27880 [Ignavibacteriaceae bacterium]|jgi:type IV secretory pathway TrbL component|nr:hypothetical protein [Chitinophagales bacterium]OQY92292.1 MAG: hypothetical protein B6D37_14990 [Sphingobacteriales bacterium UTBCD1]GJQ33949.1 MAG: hypothetical protein HBSAPP04_27880 [Ignavibacteriaceae bacterium]
MKMVIRFLSIVVIIIALGFFLNYKLGWHIRYLEIKTMKMLYIWIGLSVIGIVGLILSRD